MKTRLDFDFSLEDPFMTRRPPATRRVQGAPRRFAGTRPGVINPPPSPAAASLAGALRHTRQRLAALFPGRPKGDLR